MGRESLVNSREESVVKKFRTWAIVALCGLLGALTACSSGTSFVKPDYDFNTVGRVAVLISMNAGNPGQQQEIADLFAMQVLQKGYDVVDRANLADLINEAAFQNESGITSPEMRAKLAIRNVSAVVVVNVSTPSTYMVPPSSESYWVRGHWRPDYYGGWVWEPGHWEVRQRPGYVAQNGEDISITAKMLDVQTGSLLWAGEGTGSLKSGLTTLGGALVGAAGGALLGSAIGNTRGAIIGGVAGALGGGVAGSALEQDLAQLIRSVIEKTCRGLPGRAQPGRMVGEPAPVSSPAPAAAPAPASAPAAEPAPAPGNSGLTWPRSLQEGAATLTMYQPKIQKWTGNQISGQAAVSVAASEPIYGVASLTAAAELNKADRTVTLRDFQVTKVSFANAPDKDAQYLDGFRKLAPAGARTIPLDALEASFALSADVKAALGSGGANAAPGILFVTTPTILVLVDGQPVLKPMAGVDAERVTNTRALIIKVGPQFFLTALDFWYGAPAIEGPWTYLDNPPPVLAQAREAAAATRMVDLMRPEPGVPQPKMPPAVRVSTVPMDLIQTDGPPQLFPVEGANLLQVKNTDDPIFLDLRANQYYVLIANQWFTAKSLYGPWTAAAAQNLPPDLAKMPPSALTATHVAPAPEAAAAPAAPPGAPPAQPQAPYAAAPYDPPPPPVEVMPPSPGPDYYWNDGYWNWGPTGWFWIGGRWAIGVGPGWRGPGHPWGGWGHGRRWR
jgi:hypothetical protein